MIQTHARTGFGFLVARHCSVSSWISHGGVHVRRGAPCTRLLAFRVSLQNTVETLKTSLYVQPSFADVRDVFADELVELLPYIILKPEV